MGKPASNSAGVKINDVVLHYIDQDKYYDYVLTYKDGVATLYHNDESISSEVTLTSLNYVCSSANSELTYVKIRNIEF